jgi:proline racemase
MEPFWKKFPLREGTVRLTAIDAHTAGGPLRLIMSGLPELGGLTILERQRCMQEQFDWIRQTALQEPRGHADMCGCILTNASSQEADFGVLFPTATGYSPMSGHSLIAVVTILLETGMIPAQAPETVVKFETPAGVVQATASLDPTGPVERVSFLNVPSFVYARDVGVEVKGVGHITLDLAFGGNFCAILSASQLGLRVLTKHASTFVALAEQVKQAVNAQMALRYPLDGPDTLYSIIFTDIPQNPAHHSRNVTIFGRGQVDRSPTGVGLSARLALHDARNELAEHEELVIERILGEASTLTGRIVGRTQIGSYPAVIPRISGQAFLTGYHELLIDPRDALGQGFLVEG